MSIAVHAVRPTTQAPVKGCSVHPNMLDKLRKAGLSDEQILIDARPLLGPEARQRLEGRGFAVETESDEQVTLGLGEPQLYLTGQRAVLKEDGAAELLTFAERWVQIIRVDAQGRVQHNSIQKLP
ncbi:MAG: hypothetical protein KC910_11015 [Candidatus Eremiobacteraeota bacterium]|nr:hypothetical protein [Candidatus Eremiobacteraeota bacterium]